MATMPYIPMPPSNTPTQPYYGPNGQPSWNPFSDRDVYNQYQNIGRNQYQQSQDWQNQFNNSAGYYQGNEANASNLVNNLYNPIWQGGGGYTPEMQNNILQSQGLNDVQGQLQNNYLTGDEQAGMLGNPYAAQQQFAGQAPGLTDIAAGIGTQMQGTLAGGQGQARDAIGNWSGGAYNALDQGQHGASGAIGELQAGYSRAIDPSKLGVSQGYMPGIQSALQQGRSDVSGAQGDPGLNVTGDYLRQAGMTDQQVQDTARAAANDVGAQFGATKDELHQNAAASGTATPLGIAAAESALDRSSAASQADALTSARLNAQAAQRQAATGIQQTQLNAGQYRAGLGSQNALALQNAGIAANTGAEQLRLGANSNIANMEAGATGNIGQAELGANQFYTGAGLNTAGQLGQSGLQNAQYFTGQGLNANQQAGQALLGTATNNALTGAQLTQQGDANSAGRWGNVAQNRQGISQGNQNTQLGINNATSQRYQQAYSPWVTAQQQGLQAAQGQQQYYGGQANQQNQFRLGGWQTGNQGQLGAAQGYSGWGQNQQQNAGVTGAINNITKVIGAVSGAGNAAANGKQSGLYAHGGLIDHHQLIQVGEHDRPEVILPLDPATPPDRRNQWERMGAHLGEAMGIHHKGYASGGVIGLDAPNAFSSNLKDLNIADDPEYWADKDIKGYADGGIVGGGMDTYNPYSSNPLLAQSYAATQAANQANQSNPGSSNYGYNTNGPVSYGLQNGQFNAAGYGQNPNAPQPQPFQRSQVAQPVAQPSPAPFRSAPMQRPTVQPAMNWNAPTQRTGPAQGFQGWNSSAPNSGFSTPGNFGSFRPPSSTQAQTPVPGVPQPYRQGSNRSIPQTPAQQPNFSVQPSSSFGGSNMGFGGQRKPRQGYQMGMM